MLVECETIVVIGKYYRPIYDEGELVHRAFSVRDAKPPDMCLIPCITWWMSRTHYRVVNTHPTCIRCIAARTP